MTREEIEKHAEDIMNIRSDIGPHQPYQEYFLKGFCAGGIEISNAQIDEAIKCFNIALKGNSDEMTLLEIRTLLESLKIN